MTPQIMKYDGEPNILSFPLRNIIFLNLYALRHSITSSYNLTTNPGSKTVLSHKSGIRVRKICHSSRIPDVPET